MIDRLRPSDIKAAALEEQNNMVLPNVMGRRSGTNLDLPRPVSLEKLQVQSIVKERGNRSRIKKRS